jgi:cytochrome c biogenesis protein CcmG/thiol:disulfide interchange protein DsbE
MKFHDIRLLWWYWLLVPIVFIVGWYWSSSGPGGPGSTGQQAPQFSLQDLDGKTVSLKDFGSKVIIVDFWATWCGPCRMEIPHLNQLYLDNKGKGLQIIGVSMDDGSDVVKQFLLKNRVDYPVVMGNDGVANDFGGVEGLPTKFIIDRSGNVIRKLVGYQVAELEKTIRELLG